MEIGNECLLLWWDTLSTLMAYNAAYILLILCTPISANIYQASHQKKKKTKNKKSWGRPKTWKLESPSKSTNEDFDESQLPTPSKQKLGQITILVAIHLSQFQFRLLYTLICQFCLSFNIQNEDPKPLIVLISSNNLQN